MELELELEEDVFRMGEWRENVCERDKWVKVDGRTRRWSNCTAPDPVSEQFDWQLRSQITHTYTYNISSSYDTFMTRRTLIKVNDYNTMTRYNSHKFLWKHQ